MLDMNTLIPEILLGVGAAVFVGSLMALFRQRRPSGLVAKNASYRPRAVAPEQQIRAADHPGGKRGTVGEVAGGRKAAGGGDSPEAYQLHRYRTLFFLVAGFVAMVWGIATIVARG